MLVCGIITFNLLVIIALLIVAGRYAKKKVELFDDRAVILFAWLDRFDRNMVDFKKDIDAKFGPDLIAQLNAIFKLKQSPGSIVIGPDGKPHKINRDY